MMWDYNWMGYGFGGFFMILFWVFIIIVFFRFLRGGFGNGYGGGCCGHDHGGHADDGQKKSDAESILEQRYAKGEITKEQFEEMRKTINNKQ